MHCKVSKMQDSIADSRGLTNWNFDFHFEKCKKNQLYNSHCELLSMKRISSVHGSHSP